MSRQTRKWIIALILLPAAAYGVARLAIWYNVKDVLGSARETLSPVASLEHTRILSPVFGPFGVTGVTIQPHLFEEGITVGSVLANIKDPIEKYGYLRATMNDTLPTRFNLSLNQLRVPLTGEIGRWLDQQAPPPGDAGSSPAACRAGSPFSVRDMKAMGYQEIVSDFVLDYAYDRLNGGLVVYANVAFRDMFEVTLEGKIPPGEVIFAVERIDRVPKFSDLSITFSDTSWSQRFNRYCAGALGITETEYVERKVSQMRGMLVNAGFTPSDELMRGLERFTAGAVPLTLSLNPRDPVAPTDLAAGGDPEMVIDRLGLEVIFDNKPVENLGVVSEEKPADTEQAEAKVDETYKPTPVAELPQYLQSRARIFTEDGKLHEGYLDSIDAGKVVMTRHLVGGSVTFDVNRGDIREVLVLRP